MAKFQGHIIQKMTSDPGECHVLSWVLLRQIWDSVSQPHTVHVIYSVL